MLGPLMTSRRVLIAEGQRLGNGSLVKYGCRPPAIATVGSSLNSGMMAWLRAGEFAPSRRADQARPRPRRWRQSRPQIGRRPLTKPAGRVAPRALLRFAACGHGCCSRAPRAARRRAVCPLELVSWNDARERAGELRFDRYHKAPVANRERPGLGFLAYFAPLRIALMRSRASDCA